MLSYCIPTYKSFDLCARGIDAAMSGTVKPDKIIVIDNSGDGSGANYLYPTYQKYNGAVVIWPQTSNIGVAKSWNLFMTTIALDYVLIANDDIAVHENTLKLFLDAAESTKDSLLTAEGMLGNAYSLFLLKQDIYKSIGPFDENFSPAYYEDNDYDYRRRLLGYGFLSIAGATCTHEGSSTLKRYTPDEMNNHHNTFNRNSNYYRAKWGGVPGSESFTTPFGL